MQNYLVMKQAAVIFLIVLSISGCGRTDERLQKTADRIHEKIITVDSHCDTPIEMYQSGFDPGERHDDGCVDFPRMAEGGLDGEFFAVYIGQGPRDDLSTSKAHERALEIFKVICDNINKNSDAAGLAVTHSDAVRLKKEGKRAVFVGVENGYPIGKDLSRIKQYYDLGARYITLSHSRNNDICDSSTDPAGPEHNGISEFGTRVIEEMNRLGMMIDVSHISDKSFYDVIAKTKAPVIASHSSCRALCESPRNLTDDMLLALKDNGGVIQICILSSYLRTQEPDPRMDAELGELKKKYGDTSMLSEEQKKAMRSEYREIKKKYEKLATIKDVVDHIDHVVQVVGIDHVGIGTDFDGGGSVEGCTSVAGMKNITVELLRRGYSRQEIEKIWGGNLFRVMKKVEEVAAEI